jgi:hypothetical protein
VRVGIGCGGRTRGSSGIGRERGRRIGWRLEFSPHRTRTDAHDAEARQDKLPLRMAEEQGF